MKKKDVFTGVGIKIYGHLKAYEYDDRIAYQQATPSRVLLDCRNAVHKDNASILVSKALTNRASGTIAYMVFGNGGTTIGATGTVQFKPPKDTGTGGDLYHQTYFQFVDDREGSLSGNTMAVRHISGSLFSDVEIRCLIEQNQPFSQPSANTLPTITVPTVILNINNGNFSFDEIGLKTKDGTLLTHVIFVPIVKTASSLIEVVYTLRVAVPLITE